MIDEVHVVHARGTRGHAGQARQATIHMQNDFLGRRPVRFEHVLDQINASARAIEFVAEQLKRRTCGGAEAAMHAATAAPDWMTAMSGSRKLRFGEIRLHRATTPRKSGPG